MQQPLVSVIIPSYNSAAFLPDSIESVLRQTYTQREVIVVDDGSSDNTADVIHPYLDRITFIAKANGGPASARNAGLRVARGVFLGFLDADDYWHEEKLDRQMAVMLSRPEVGLVACGLVAVTPDRAAIGEYLYRNYTDREDFLRRLCGGNKVGGGSSALVRRSVLERVGMFDENLHGTEDWDMWLRLALEADVHFVEEPLVYVRERPDGVSSSANAERMLANEIKLLDKLFARPDLSFGARDKARIYARRYLLAARTLKDVGEIGKAWTYHRKAVRMSTSILLDPSYAKMALLIFWRILPGGKRS